MFVRHEERTHVFGSSCISVAWGYVITEDKDIIHSFIHSFAQYPIDKYILVELWADS